MGFMIKKIVSDGQNGVSLGGLLASADLDIDHSGFVPMSFDTEQGPEDVIMTFQKLLKIKTKDPLSVITKNIAISDATLIMTDGKLTKRSRAGVLQSRLFSKPFFHVDLSKKTDFAAAIGIKSWIKEIRKFLNVSVLDVVGSLESKSPGISERTRSILVMVFENDLANN